MKRPRRVTRFERDPRGAPGDEEPEAVRVWLLGGFRVSVGSRTIGENEWRLKKAVGLIKLLALKPGHRLHRERLMELLWPELGTEAAANNLHQALYVARRILEPVPAASSRYLDLREEWLALCPNVPLWVDVEAFEEAAATARRLREPAAYQVALELYSGELLPEDLYEGWAEARREGLRRDYLALIVELAGLYEEREEYRPAIETLEQAVAEEQAHEEAHAGLMRLYALSGRQGKALGQYERLREALSREPGKEPGAASRSLHQEILSGRFPPAPPPRKEEGRHPEESLGSGWHNLPTRRTSFIGRELELAEVKRELGMARLLTLTGAGGSGKTRLALEVARDLVGAYPDGVWVVELAGLSEGELVLQEVAATFEVREQPNRTLLDTLVNALKSKPLLLVLDNCEHLIEAAARLADDLLGSCPKLRILATSREPLRVPGEVVRRVPPLSLPDPEDPAPRLARSEAARLFLERARSRERAFGLSGRNARAVADICRRLDGIPLAIELAAARVGTLSAEQISAKLVDSLKLLTSDGRTMDPRHRTLRATLDWSHRLLGEPEGKLFERLSVFAGGWTLEAAEAVGAGSSIGPDEVLDLLGRLVDKSLVMAEEGEEGAPRYRMLEPVRQYGREKFEENAEEAGEVKHRHAAFFIALAEEAEPELRGSQQGEWLEQLEVEHDNLRAALSWALELGEAELGLRLGGTLGWFWHMRGYLSEGRRWLEAALARGDAPDASVQVKALHWAGWMAWEQHDHERSTVLSEEALALSRRLGDTAGTAAALYNLGMTALMHQMRYERAFALLEEAAALWRQMGDTVGLVQALQGLGLAAASRKDYERATALYEEGLALAQQVEDKFGIALSLGLGALTFMYQGEYRRAEALCAEGLEVSRQLGMRHAIAFMLHISAGTVGGQGQPVRSARLWGAAEALYEAIGTTLSLVQRYHYEPYIDAARAQLGDEAAWEAAWAEGRAMAPEEAIEYALAQGQPLSTIPAPVEASTVLTRREWEVAVLVGRRLTNRRIAEELSISEHTAITHVRNILKKLGVHSRAQITAWLAEQGHL